MTGDLVRSVVVAKDIQLAEDRCADELQTHFENALSTAEVTAILSMVVAHNFAPYGASSALKYDQLINEAKLDCDNYSALQGHLASDTLQFRYVGFEGGSLGNHAQVYLEAATDHRAMFLDPTVSIFAFVDFDDYLQGKKVDAYQISQQRFQIKSLNRFAEKVSSSFVQGRVKPSDLLYYYFGLDHRLGEMRWTYLTPGGEDLYNRRRPSAKVD